MTKIIEPNLDNNCGKCTWSTRDPTDLLISCTLGKKIKNTWVTAHNCQDYADISKIKKKRTPNRQLDLFIHQNL